MNHLNREELKKLAHEHEIPWQDVLEIARGLYRQAWVERADIYRIRCEVWRAYNSKVWRGTCRQSMKLKYRRAFNGGDHTMIPNFDLVAESISIEFRRDDTDAVEWLWEIITADKDHMPRFDDLLQQALNYLAFTGTPT